MSENRGASVDGVDVRCLDRFSTRDLETIASDTWVWDRRRQRWVTRLEYMFNHYYDDGAMGPGAD